MLFLDELPEFDLHTLETLRQPLEAGHVTIARARGAAHLSSQVTLIAAGNPVPLRVLWRFAAPLRLLGTAPCSATAGASPGPSSTASTCTWR